MNAIIENDMYTFYFTNISIKEYENISNIHFT